MDLEFLGLFKDFGFPALVAGFFLIKDWRLTTARIEADKQLAAALSALKTVIELRGH
jgi:hypothetical protein